jgi:tetratricopeptide (TPR) repeat protein
MIKMKRIDTLLGVGLLVLFFSGSGLCLQEGRGTGRLLGIVTDEAGNPVEGAAITLEYQEFTRRLTTATNGKGQWGFIGLGRGGVSVTSEKEGFAKSAIQLFVSGVNKNPDQKIVMKKISGSEAAPGIGDSAKEALAEGNKYFEEKRFTEALVLYQDFVEKNPALYKVRLNAANCLMELQKYDQAVAEYQKVLEGLNAEAADKKDAKLEAQIYAGIGDAYLRMNKFAEAEQYFKKSMDIDPADHALAFNVAEIMMQAGNTDEAIRYYDMAIRIKADWPKSYLKLGYAWLNKGDMPKAIEAFNKFIAVSPGDDPDVALVKDIIKKISKTG